MNAAPPVPFERIATLAAAAAQVAEAPAQPAEAPEQVAEAPEARLDAGPRAAAAFAPEPQAGPAPAVRTTPAVPAGPAPAEILFAPDSSELAGAALARLEALVAALPRGSAWEVELSAAVGDRAGPLAADQALAYNRRLAERRQSRVEEWLGTHPGAPVLRVRRSLLPHDPSRRLVIDVRPLP
jgi:hypothetical protein